MQTLIDPFQRTINYLRVSVTEHCNYRCFYCRDDLHTSNCKREDILSYEEIGRIVAIFANLGVRKVRLTGGEPLLRKNLEKLVALLHKIPNINDIPLSTNAHLLPTKARALKLAGLSRVNISLDSLIPERFDDITRGGDLAQVIRGIEAAIQQKIQPIKLNMVVMRGINDDEIEAMIDFAIAKKIHLRFIETMPIGSAGIEILSQHYPEKKILQRINAHLSNKITPLTLTKTGGPAKNFAIDGTQSTVGIISAVSNSFCQTCNRVRLSAKGDLILCLGQENKLSLKDALRAGKTDEQIQHLIVQAIGKKPEKHEFSTSIENVSTRQMVEIGG